MIETLKSTLIQIRREREEELQKFCSLSGNDPKLCEEKKAILTLELPFKTDKVSITHARAKAYRDKDMAKDKFLEIESDEKIEEQDVLIIKNNKVLKKNGIIYVVKKISCNTQRKPFRLSSLRANSIFTAWIKSAKKTKTKQGRRTFYNILKKSVTYIYSPHPRFLDVLTSNLGCVFAEDLPHTLTMQAMENVIQNLDVSDSTKKIYTSIAKNLRKYVMKASPIFPTLAWKRSVCELSLLDATKLLEYLETRALKSKTIEKYHDLLICRTLLYAPLSSKSLFLLQPPMEDTSCLHSEGKVYDVPLSFLKLCKAFPCHKGLFMQIFDDKGLHQKLQRLGKSAKLSIKSLSPTILRSFAETIYQKHLSIDDKVIDHLPRRI